MPCKMKKLLFILFCFVCSLAVGQDGNKFDDDNKPPQKEIKKEYWENGRVKKNGWYYSDSTCVIAYYDSSIQRIDSQFISDKSGKLRSYFKYSHFDSLYTYYESKGWYANGALAQEEKWFLNSNNYYFRFNKQWTADGSLLSYKADSCAIKELYSHSLMQHWKNSFFKGMEITYHRNGMKKTETSFVTNLSGGLSYELLKNGKRIEYDTLGKIHREEFYESRKGTGHWKEWYDTGELSWEGFFRNDTCYLSNQYY